MPYNPNYYFPAGYQPIQPMPQINAQPQPQVQMNNNTQNSNGVIWVQGEAGAKAFPVAAGCSVFMMDVESPTAYLKTVEGNGMPQPLKVYDLIERTAKATPVTAAKEEERYVTKDEFEAFRERVTASLRGVRKSEVKKEAEDGKSDL